MQQLAKPIYALRKYFVFFMFMKNSIIMMLMCLHMYFHLGAFSTTCDYLIFGPSQYSHPDSRKPPNDYTSQHTHSVASAHACNCMNAADLV